MLFQKRQKLRGGLGRVIGVQKKRLACFHGGLGGRWAPTVAQRHTEAATEPEEDADHHPPSLHAPHLLLACASMSRDGRVAGRSARLSWRILSPSLQASQRCSDSS